MDFKNKKKFKYNSYIAGILLLGIIILINFLSYNMFSRIDLTEDQQFTISNATKKVLGKLDDIVTIKLFFSKELPINMENMKKDIKDSLAEFKIYSKGNLQIEYIDPGDDQELKKKLQMYGIPEVQMNVYEKDKIQAIKGYFGIGIFYADKKEVIPFLQDLTNFEYDMITSIKKVTSSEIKKIGFICGEKDIYKDWKHIVEILRKQYEVSKVELKKANDIDKYETFIVLNVKALSEWEVFQIDQLVMKGKKMIFLVDTFSVGNNLQASFSKNPLENILKKYGVMIEKNVTLDTMCGMASFNQGFMTFSQPYPYFVKVSKVNMDKDTPVLSKVDSLLLPWSSSLTLMTNNIKDNKVVKLFNSSEKSWTQEGKINLMPNQKFAAGRTQKSELLGVLVSGQFESYYKGKKAPSKEDQKDDKTKTDKKEEKVDIIDNSQKESHIIVIGNSSFLDMSHIQQSPSNFMFINNAVDWMTLDDSLIKIRAKSVNNRMIDLSKLGEPNSEDIDSGKAVIKYLNIFLMSFVVIFLGIFKHILRKRSRNTI
jgi:gliding-associated putative ABC transporter substrate-binding component GldG